LNTRLLVALATRPLRSARSLHRLTALVALHTATLPVHCQLAGCLVRNMALRAELAARVEGHEYGRAVGTGAVADPLGGAEPALRPPWTA